MKIVLFSDRWTARIAFFSVLLFFLCSCLSENKLVFVSESNINRTNETLTVFLDGGIPLEMIKIKAGSFIMGSSKPAGEGTLSEAPHHVTLTCDYWIGKYEVTEEQYDAVTKWPRCQHEECGRVFHNKKRTGHEAMLPVGCMSWIDAMRFCAYLTERERKTGRLPQGYVYLLPTEAQWENACKSGGKIEGLSKLATQGWFMENSEGIVQPCGKIKPNNAGIYDMTGNLREWCLDDADDYVSISASNPLVFSDKPHGVLRGGSVYDRMDMCTCEGRWMRHRAMRGQPSNGFRVALVLVPPDIGYLHEYIKGSGLLNAD